MQKLTSQVLHVLHHDHNVFCTEQNRAEHNRAIGQTWETRTFAELELHLNKRAQDAKPDVILLEDDDVSEPDMSWVNQPPEMKMANTPSISNGNNETMEDIMDNTQEQTDKDIIMPDIHDIATPPGSKPNSVSSTPLRTPVAPTPLSPSPSPKQELTQTQTESLPSAKQNGTPSPTTSPTVAKVFSPANPTSTEVTIEPPAQHSPSSFTPVQTEDSNIFTKSYYELATERMEQDRERQRRKEDSSGFVALAGTVDEEVLQILEVPTKGDVWVEDLIAERGVWGMMGE